MALCYSAARKQGDTMPKLTKTQKLTRTAMLTAITLILALTPLGYIPVNPAITVTLMVIPVALGGLVYGWPAGLFLGLVFGISSFARAPGELIGQLMLAQSGLLTFAACVLPRAAVGLLAGLGHLLIKRSAKLRRVWFYAVTGLACSFLNTLCFLGFVSLAFDQAQTGITGTVIWGIVSFNGSIEAVVNAVLVAILARVLLGGRKGAPPPMADGAGGPSGPAPEMPGDEPPAPAGQAQDGP